MAWRAAKSLLVLRSQINEIAPDRSIASDGLVADTAHAARKSDHNADAQGVVRALDITHDPVHGIDGDKLADALIDSRDKRIKYVIWERRIASGDGGRDPWTWRPYKGANPHTKHLHVSVVSGPKADDPREWVLRYTPEYQRPTPTLRKGEQGQDVAWLQMQLGAAGFFTDVDASFGPKTEAAVKMFQKALKLKADGVAGPITWAALTGTVAP